MLKVTDHFKAWMRDRLADFSYAECIFQALIDEEDATLLEVWPHAALPMKSTLDDPEAMIGMLKGYDNDKGVDIVVAIFGKWEDFKDLSRSYFSIIWGTRHASLLCLALTNPSCTFCTNYFCTAP